VPRKGPFCCFSANKRVDEILDEGPENLFGCFFEPQLHPQFPVDTPTSLIESDRYFIHGTSSRSTQRFVCAKADRDHPSLKYVEAARMQDWKQRFL
jgi:hypothetical protein